MLAGLGMQFRSLEYGDEPKSETPFRIFAALLHRTLGDFTDQLLFAASVAEMFPEARLDVCFRPDRPFKPEIVSLAPQVTSSWETKNRMPIDLFDTAGMRPIVGPEAWYVAGCDAPDLVLTPSMCEREKLGYFEPSARFRIPGSDHWDARLRDAVGDGGFCILHYREAGYEFSQAGTTRNIDTWEVEPVVDVLLRQGVRVVRIGHPEMAPLRQRDGYVDLCAAPFMLQACAISHARFFMEVSPSGPYAIANGFGVSMARCNALIPSGPSTPDSIVLARPVLDGKGKNVTADIVAGGLNPIQSITDNSDHRLGANSIEQIASVAADLIAATEAVSGWRGQPVEAPDDAVEPPFTWPIPKRARHRIAV